jgi:hypothetical protein
MVLIQHTHTHWALCSLPWSQNLAIWFLHYHLNPAHIFRSHFLKTASILSFHLLLGLPVGLCHWIFPPQHSPPPPPHLSFPMHATAPIILHCQLPCNMKCCWPHAQSTNQWLSTCRPSPLLIQHNSLCGLPEYRCSWNSVIKADKDEPVRRAFSFVHMKVLPNLRCNAAFYFIRMLLFLYWFLSVYLSCPAWCPAVLEWHSVNVQ